MRSGASAQSLKCWFILYQCKSINTIQMMLYLIIIVDSDTDCVWRNKSNPKQQMMTAATFVPPAPVCMAWNTKRSAVEMTAVHHGIIQSTRRPTNGTTITPNIPTRLNKPMIKLDIMSAKVWVIRQDHRRGVVIWRSAE